MTSVYMERPRSGHDDVGWSSLSFARHLSGRVRVEVVNGKTRTIALFSASPAGVRHTMADRWEREGDADVNWVDSGFALTSRLRLSPSCGDEHLFELCCSPVFMSLCSYMEAVGV